MLNKIVVSQKLHISEYIQEFVYIIVFQPFYFRLLNNLFLVLSKPIGYIDVANFPLKTEANCKIHVVKESKF
jgi:hypothetical protein